MIGTARMLILLGVGLSITGCMPEVADVTPKIDFKPPQYVQELPSQEPEDEMPRMGSLFGQGERPLFTDRKAMKLNDIVTVLVSEQISSSASGQKQLSQTNASDLGGANINFTGPQGRESARLQGLNDLANYEYQNNTNTQYQGQGSTSKENNFDAKITVRVVKVMNNGNYFVYGKREMLIDGEKQIMKLSGVISPYDINQNNEVHSSKISDAKIAYYSQGDIHQSTKQGDATRAAEALWPF